MRDLTQRLIAAERRSGAEPDVGGRAGFRVCERLRQPLATFAGIAGYRALLARALTLAKARAPLLTGVQLTSAGAFTHSAEVEARLDTEEAGAAAAALTDELVGLLIAFIGEALTLRLVHDVWPDALGPDSTLGANQL